MKVKLEDVIAKTAQLAIRHAARQPLRTQSALAAARGRTVAQEYIRNGFDLPAAFETVTKRTYPRRGTKSALGAAHPYFLAEVQTMMQTAAVDKDVAAAQLWHAINASPLDFMQEDGRSLSVEQLKKLPRAMQAIIGQIKIASKDVPVCDEQGKPMLDDNGKPILGTIQHVELELLDKLTAIDRLAKLLSWYAPEKIELTTPVGRLMQYADQRGRALAITYEHSEVPPEPGVRPGDGSDPV